MRRKKRTTVIILCFMMIMACSTSVLAKKPSKRKVKKSYLEYIDQNLKGFDYYTHPSAYFIDINRDGVKEMIYTEEGRAIRPSREVYTYKKGTVIKVADIAGYLYYSKKNKRICTQGYVGGAGRYTVYKLSGTRLIKTKEYFYNSIYNKFTKNGVSVSSEKFSKEIDKIMKWKYYV